MPDSNRPRWEISPLANQPAADCLRAGTDVDGNRPCRQQKPKNVQCELYANLVARTDGRSMAHACPRPPILRILRPDFHIFSAPGERPRFGEVWTCLPTEVGVAGGDGDSVVLPPTSAPNSPPESLRQGMIAGGTPGIGARCESQVRLARPALDPAERAGLAWCSLAGEYRAVPMTPGATPSRRHQGHPLTQSGS